MLIYSSISVKQNVSVSECAVLGVCVDTHRGPSKNALKLSPLNVHLCGFRL